MIERIKRVNQLIKHEISQLINREIDFDNTLVTVTRVDTSPDLKQAKIGIIVLPQEETEQALKILEKNIYHIQQLLNKKLRMKYIPKIIFEIDKTEVNAQRLEEVLQQIKKS